MQVLYKHFQTTLQKSTNTTVPHQVHIIQNPKGFKLLHMREREREITSIFCCSRSSANNSSCDWVIIDSSRTMRKIKRKFQRLKKREGLLQTLIRERAVIWRAKEEIIRQRMRFLKWKHFSERRRFEVGKYKQRFPC